jgi:hypothetical protein
MMKSLATKLKENYLLVSNNLRKLLRHMPVPNFSKLRFRKSTSSADSTYSYPAPAYFDATSNDKKLVGLQKVGAFVKTFFASLRSFLKRSTSKLGSSVNTTDREKLNIKSIRVIGLSAASVFFLLVIFINFGFVKVSQGIETTRGLADNKTVFISKTNTVSNNDLAVAVLPGTGDDSEELLVMGTVFSSNAEYYAIYDGEVIWQIPLDQIRGKVLFAKATQVP